MRWFLSGLVVLLTAADTWAHHSPSHVVEQLSERMRANPHDLRLVLKRAEALRAMGKLAASAADYRRVLSDSGQHPVALHGLARVLIAQQRFEEALATTKRGIDSATTVDRAAPFHALRARALEGLGNRENALKHWELAIRSSKPEVDWLLAHAEALRDVGRNDEVTKALAEAVSRNRSVVLRREWIAALIDSGDTQQARALINKGLDRSRRKSSWLLLRARLKLAGGDAQGAGDDARAALGELKARLRRAPKNPFLVKRRDEVVAFLGQLSQALGESSSSTRYSVACS